LSETFIGIVGRRSALSRALFSHLEILGLPFEAIGLSDVMSENPETKKTLVQRLAGFDTIIWTGALTNRNLPRWQLEAANWKAPLEFLRLLDHSSNLRRVVFLGSVFEDNAGSNLYLKSKAMLSRDLVALNDPRVMYLRTHTLIGPQRPQPQMLLGQILDSVLKGPEDFKLGSPKAVRQYIDMGAFAKFLLEVALSKDFTLKPFASIGGGYKTDLEGLVTLLLSNFGSQVSLRIDGEYSWESNSEPFLPSDDVCIYPTTGELQVLSHFREWIEASGREAD